jgi:isopropylmalate/isohomocitrate dehydrogenase-like protein
MRKVCVISGDGIGLEVVPQAVRVLEALRAPITMVEAQMGLECHGRTGEYLPAETVERIRECDATLFGAITSPPSGTQGYRSPILALRKEFDLYANLRPVRRLRLDIGLVDLDCMIVRENTEGMYTGREREIEGGVVLERIVTEKACRRLVRRALDVCRDQGRKSITCVHKANVLRTSDGMFRRIFFEEVAGMDITANDMLVDAAAAALVASPSRLECIVTLNLYGDILSDEAAALTGGLGLAPSVNMGDAKAVFEPTHGSAPDIAGRGIANPVAAMLSATMMLRYLDFEEHAARAERAIEVTLGDGVRTPDIGGTAGTSAFTDAVLSHL